MTVPPVGSPLHIPSHTRSASLLKHVFRALGLPLLAVAAMTTLAEAQPYVYALGIEPLSNKQRLTLINAATQQLVAGVALGRTQGTRPEDMIISPDGTRIFVINSLDFNISVVSTQTGAIDTWAQSLVGNSPQGMAGSPDNRRLYVTSLDVVNNQLRGSLVVVDVASKSRLTTIPFGSKKTYGVAASPDGSRLYVATETEATGLSGVTVLDTATFGVITDVPLSGTPFGTTVSLSPDGRFAYLPRQPITSVQAPGIVDVLDTTTNTIVATTTVASNPRFAAVSPNGATVYVTAPTISGGALQRLDATTHALLGSIAMPQPIAVAFGADSARAFVAAVNEVTVVDTASGTITGHIPIPSRLLDNSPGNRIAAIVTSPPAVAPPGSAPGSPALTAQAAMNPVTLNWAATSGGAPTGYTILVGTQSGASNIATIGVGLATSISANAPVGVRLYVRVVAQNGAGSAVSNEVTFTLPAPPPPAAPILQVPNVVGTAVQFAWTGSTPGATHTLVARTAPGGPVIATLPVGTSTVFTVPGVPSGTYYVSVIAQTAAGTATSNEVSVTVQPPPPPAPPTMQTPTVTGSTVFLSWSNAGPGVSYTLLARTTPAGAPIVVAPLGAGTTLNVPNVPAGTYYVSVVAQVGGLTSAESNQVVAVVP